MNLARLLALDPETLVQRNPHLLQPIYDRLPKALEERRKCACMWPTGNGAVWIQPRDYPAEVIQLVVGFLAQQGYYYSRSIYNHTWIYITQEVTDI